MEGGLVALGNWTTDPGEQFWRRLSDLAVREQPDDGPTKFLLSRVLQCLVDPDTFDPVFVAPGK